MARSFVREWLRFAIATALAATCLVSPASATAQDERPPQAAQDAYASGRESYRLGLYGRALEEFERSLSLAPSPNTRLYIARTLRELGRWSEAAAQYRLTIKEAADRGGRYGGAREAADLELRDVQVRIERAEPNREPRPVTPEPDKTQSTPTPASPEATAPRSASRAEGGGPNTTLTLVSAGVAALGAASFGVFYGLASDRYGYLEDNCRVLRSAACDDARSTGQTQETIAYVSLGVAVVAATVATVSLLLKPSAGAPRSARVPLQTPWRVAF